MNYSKRNKIPNGIQLEDINTFKNYAELIVFCSITKKQLNQSLTQFIDISNKNGYLQSEWFNYSLKKLNEIDENNIRKLETEINHLLKRDIETEFPLLNPIFSGPHIQNANQYLFEKYFKKIFNTLLVVSEEIRFTLDMIYNSKKTKDYKGFLNQSTNELNDWILVIFKRTKYEFKHIKLGSSLVNLQDQCNIFDQVDKPYPPWKSFFENKLKEIIEIKEYGYERTGYGSSNAKVILYCLRPDKSSLPKDTYNKTTAPKRYVEFTNIVARTPKFPELKESINKYIKYLELVDQIRTEFIDELNSKLKHSELKFVQDELEKKFDYISDNLTIYNFHDKWKEILFQTLMGNKDNSNYALLLRIKSLPNEQRVDNLFKTFFLEFLDTYINRILIYLEEINNIKRFINPTESEYKKEDFCNNYINKVVNLTRDSLGVKINYNNLLFNSADKYLSQIIHVNEEISDVYKGILLPKRYIREIKRFGYERVFGYERERTEVILS